MMTQKFLVTFKQAALVKYETKDNGSLEDEKCSALPQFQRQGGLDLLHSETIYVLQLFLQCSMFHFEKFWEHDTAQGSVILFMITDRKSVV